MKTMIIGLVPNYNYPGNFEKWRANNTHYASNFGACLITRTLMRQFDGEYVEDLSNPSELNAKYDRCVIALATHLTSRRDLTYLADLVEQLDMPVLMPSLGIQDYVTDVFKSSDLHPSVFRLIDLVLKRSKLIGVRGPHTASLLYKAGISDVVPVGCPTLYHNMDPDFQLKAEADFSNPLIVYHRTLMEECRHVVSGVPMLGQDFLDEVVFTDNLKDDVGLRKVELPKYDAYPEALDDISKLGIFPKDFDDWFTTIGSKSFVFGPRLHGCIAAILQGVPALMTARDLRVREIAEFFNIPFITLDRLKHTKQSELTSLASFDRFNESYPHRYRNYVEFLGENGFGDNQLGAHKLERGIQWNHQDLRTTLSILYKSQESLIEELAKHSSGGEKRKKRFFRF